MAQLCIDRKRLLRHVFVRDIGLLGFADSLALESLLAVWRLAGSLYLLRGL